jgi:hypothetical protein
LETNGVANLEGTISSSNFTQPTTFRRKHHSLPYSIFCDLHEGYIQMTLFLKIPKWGPKIGNFIVPKFWMFISSSNHDILKHVKEIFYSFQKDLFNGALHTLVGVNFILACKGICG